MADAVSGPSASSIITSLWQANLAGIRVERVINWTKDVNAAQFCDVVMSDHDDYKRVCALMRDDPLQLSEQDFTILAKFGEEDRGRDPVKRAQLALVPDPPKTTKPSSDVVSRNLLGRTLVKILRPLSARIAALEKTVQDLSLRRTRSIPTTNDETVQALLGVLDDVQAKRIAGLVRLIARDGGPDSNACIEALTDYHQEHRPSIERDVRDLVEHYLHKTGREASQRPA
jgi:hypothetical protein